MTPTNLGVIFGPCLLRCDRPLDAAVSLAHVPLQTTLVARFDLNMYIFYHWCMRVDVRSWKTCTASVCNTTKRANYYYITIIAYRCIKCLIEEQQKKWLYRMDNIRAIDTATHATVYRLSLVRAWDGGSKVCGILGLCVNTPARAH